MTNSQKNRTIKILHTGDIHLDSPFSSLPPRQAEIRRQELRSAFTSMTAYAKMDQIDMILIAGDMFDGEHITRDTLLLISKELENYKKPVFITPGNHDPATPSSVWLKDIFPKNVHVFTSNEVEAVEIEELGVIVYGFAFTSQCMDVSPLANLTVEESDKINILLCHGDLTDKNSTSCPITPEELDSFGADYTALGHIHNPRQPEQDARYSYCGCLEGRAFDELGPKGASVVTVKKRGFTRASSEVSLKRVRFSKKRYEKSDCSLDGASTLTEVKERLSRHVTAQKFGEDVCLELTLRGRIDSSLLIDTEELSSERFAGELGVFYVRVIDKTLPELDVEYLLRDVSLRGEVYRRLAPMLESEDEREKEIAERALRYAFSAISGESF